jgi:drug/metabolite transporter (DMT)-like permease
VRDYLQLHLIILLWSLTAILGKLITMPALDMVVWRTGLAALGFAAWAALLRVPVALPARERLMLLGLGALLGWHWVLFFQSARMSTASVSLAAMPLLMICCSLLEPLVDGSRRWKASELTLGLIIVGAVWMIYEVEFRYWQGFTVGLASVVLAAFFSVGNKRIAHRYHFTVLMGWQMVGALLACWLTLPLATGQLLPVGLAGMDIVWLLALSLVCTVLPYAGYGELIKRLSVFTINVTYNLETVYGILLAAAAFGEREKMSLGFYCASAIILLSVIVLPWWNRRRGVMPPVP